MRKGILVGVALIILTSCAGPGHSPAGSSQASDESSSPGPGPTAIASGSPTPGPTGIASIEQATAPQPWKDPLLAGVKMSLSEAESNVSFVPRVPPDSLGVATVISNDPDRVPMNERGISWLFDSESGLFAVIERPSQITEAQLEELATCQPDETGCSTVGWSLTTLDMHATALSVDAPNASGVIWLENGIEFTIVGPSDSFSSEQALAIANQVA